MGYKYQKRKTLMKYIEKTKVDAMLERARAINKRDYLLILTLWKTGMRNSDVIHFTKRDIKIDHITVRQGKGNKDRIVPIDTLLYDLLQFHTTSIGLDDKVFPLSDMSIRNIVHKYQGDENVHPHTLRHSFAVFYLKSGGNIRCLQKILGHTDLNVTAEYLDLIADDIKEDYKKLKW